VFDVKSLDLFYKEMSGPDGMHVADFQYRLEALFNEDRSSSDTDDYRLGKNPWKKLSDEIVTVSRFLSHKNIESGRIRFPLDNKIPDCWLFDDQGEALGIEVTIERGRERYRLAKEINKDRVGRGFIGMQDAASRAEFDLRMSNPRTMYTTEQALNATKCGIACCLKKKNDLKYEGMFCLLIQAHLTSLPKERWRAIEGELTQTAISLPFKEIHVIANADTKPWGFKIK
jgi:hypothetical protein